MNRLTYLSNALTDLAAIQTYAAADSEIAARKVIRTIVEAASRLKLFPYLGRGGSVKGTFELVVPKLPFVVVYRIDRATVEIVAIVHVRRSVRVRTIT